MINKITYNEYNNLFQCNMCGKCCLGYGGVYLTYNDIDNLSKYLNISQKKFIFKYTQLSNDRVILNQKKEGFCIFWEKAKSCLIHAVKPKMCNTWPFLTSVIVNIKNWEIVYNNCPGANKNLSKNLVQKSILKFVNEKAFLFI